MTRTLSYLIDEENARHSIKEYLRQKGYSSQLLIQLRKNPACILIDNTPTRMSRMLQAGELLTVNIFENRSSEKIKPVKLPLDIVYEDEDILVLNKPSDMPIHPSLSNYDNTVANALAWYYEEQKKPFIFRCINRLDRDTSGLTLIARHALSAGILSEMLRNKASKKGIHREYLAIVQGDVSPKSGCIDAPIARKSGSIVERTVDYELGERAVTHYHVVKTVHNHSLVSLVLETGRTHQIRVHMKHLGFPLIGDYLYNPDYSLISRQALHSHRLDFTHPITGREMHFTAPMPPDMYRIIGNN